MDRIAGILIGEALNMTGGSVRRQPPVCWVSRPTLNSKIEKYNLQSRHLNRLRWEQQEQAYVLLCRLYFSILEFRVA